jgi:hypothetical protein
MSQQIHDESLSMLITTEPQRILWARQLLDYARTCGDMNDYNAINATLTTPIDVNEETRTRFHIGLLQTVCRYCSSYTWIKKELRELKWYSKQLRTGRPLSGNYASTLMEDWAADGYALEISALAEPHFATSTSPVTTLDHVRIDAAEYLDPEDCERTTLLLCFFLRYANVLSSNENHGPEAISV